MAIAAQRFKFLDEETNVGIATFGLNAEDSILNNPINERLPANESLDELINSSVEQALAEEGVDPLSLENFTRFTKDMKSQIVDIMNLPTDTMSGFFDSIGNDNPIVAKSLSNIVKKCPSGRGLGYGRPGRGWNPSMNCGSGSNISLGSKSKACNASSYGDMLKRLTNGQYAPGFKDKNALLAAIMALSGYGYNLGMCGVFSSLSAGIEQDVLSRAAGSLLGSLGDSGNSNGFFDLAKSSIGLTPLLTNPSVIGNFFDNFQLPNGTRERNLTTVAESALGSAELINDKCWSSENRLGSGLYDLDVSPTPSLAEIALYRDGFGDAAEAELANRSYSYDDIDVAPSGDQDFLLGSYAMMV